MLTKVLHTKRAGNTCAAGTNLGKWIWSRRDIKGSQDQHLRPIGRAPGAHLAARTPVSSRGGNQPFDSDKIFRHSKKRRRQTQKKKKKPFGFLNFRCSLWIKF